MKTISATIFFVILFTVAELKAETFTRINMDSAQIQSTDTLKAKQLYLVTKLNKIEYVCEILSDDGREILISTDKLVKIYIPKSDISSIEKFSDKTSVVRGKYYDEDPFATRYSFTTNALPIKKGTKYVVFNLLGPEVHFAISNNFGFGVLSTWIGTPLMLTLIYSFKTNSEKLNFSIGTLMGTTSYLNDFKGVIAMPYVNATFGDTKNNMTISTGYFYLNSKLEFGDVFSIPVICVPEISIAGTVKLTPKTSFIYDGMIGNNDIGYGFQVFRPFLMLMPGVRFQSNSNNAFQVSIADLTFFPVGVTIPFPMLSWFLKF